MAGLRGDVGVRRVETNVNLSFSDILDALKFGVMGTAEARFKSYVVSVDGMYLSLGGSQVVAVRGDTGNFTLDQKETMIQPALGYTIGEDSWGVDFLASIRYWDLSTTLDVDRTKRPSNQRSGSRSWVDAVGGFQFHFMPLTLLRITAGADGGAGGAKSTWQAYGGLGGDFANHWTLSGFYRGLSVDYHHDDVLFDTTTQGFVVSVTFRF